MMRPYQSLLRNVLMARIQSFRHDNHFSQEHMAELLHISPRSYADLEHGKYCFSTPSFIFFLLLLSDTDIRALLDNIRSQIDKADSDDVA